MESSAPIPLSRQLEARFQAREGQVFVEGVERERLSGGELLGAMARVRAGLREAGLKRDHRIGLVAAPGVATLAAMLSLLGESRLSLLDPAAPEERLLEAARLLRLDGLVAIRGVGGLESAAGTGLRLLELELAGGAAAGLRVVEGQAGMNAPGAMTAVEVLFLTSGTGGASKVVPISGRNLAASAAHIGEAMQLGAEDRFLCMARMHHIAGLALVLAELVAGGVVIAAPGFHGAAFAGWLEQARPTWFWAAPAMLQDAVRQMRKRPDALEGVPLRLIRVGSAPLPAALAVEAEEVFGVPVLETYGMTEASPQITCTPLPPGERKAGSAGVAAGPELRIVNGRGERAAVGEEGEITVRGQNVIDGYEGDSGDWGKRFVQGWFHTGDLGYVDGQGYLFVTGRLGDVINRGGTKVSPRPVEGRLLEHPSVGEAVVFGVPHPSLGQEVCGMVVPRPGTTAQPRELRRWLAARLPAEHVPAEILVRYDIPKDPGGKVSRRELGAAFAGMIAEEPRESVAEHREPVTAIERRLEEMWRKVLRISRAGLDDDFFELGGDSFAAVLLWAQIQNEFRLKETGDRMELVTQTTIANQAAAIEGLLRRRGELRGLHPCLVPLKRRGVAAPLFVVPLGAELPEYYQGLTGGVGPETPMYALFDPEPAEKRGFVTVERRAALFVEAIRSVQPEGPYRLFGDCFGGAVAYEMAQQLRAAGEAV